MKSIHLNIKELEGGEHMMKLHRFGCQAQEWARFPHALDL